MSNHQDLDLTVAANSFDIPAGDVDAVVSRGRARSQRRRALMATVTTIAVVTGAVTFIGTRGNDGDGDGTDVLAEGTTNAKVGDDGLTWTRVNGAAGLAWMNDASGTTPVYALSTAPGERMTQTGNTRQNSTLYRSDDGVDWIAATRFGNDLFLADLAPTKERVYAVGTGPATATVGTRKVSNLLAGWSDDAGKTWSKSTLPIDMTAVAAKTLHLSTYQNKVVTNATGTLIVSTLMAALDVPALLPDGATAPNGWATTPTGVDVLGPRRANACPAGSTAEKDAPPNEKPGEVGPTYCSSGDGDRREAVAAVAPQESRGVVASHTFEQLGVDGDLLKAVRSEPYAFFAPAGSTSFERVDLPTDPVDSLFAAADGSGFDIILTRRDPQGQYKVGPRPRPTPAKVLHSADGRTFAASGDIAGLPYVTSAGEIGGQSVFVGGNSDGGPVLVRKVDGAWTTTDLAALVARGPDERGYLGPVGIGPAGIAMVISIVEEKLNDDGSTEQRGNMRHALLSSRDGGTWKVQALADLVGARVLSPQGVVVTDQQMVVTVALANDRPNEPAPRVTLVGTPR